MSQRSLPVLFFLVLLLAACAPLSTQPITPSGDQNSGAPVSPPENTQAPTSTPTLTPTPLDEQVVVLTNEPPDIVLTSVNLQLEQNSFRLTEAANQIATLSAESKLLETKVATVRTQAAATVAASVANNNSGPTNNSSSNYTIPANVYTITTTARKAYIWIPTDYNDNDAPIMDLHEPRVFFPPGTEAWVYKNPIKADGGALYYESYDPDGEIPEYKIYFQGRQIQVRLPYGSPNPADYPSNVAKAILLEKTAVHVVNSYDDAGKPIMETYKPYIHYDAGKKVILYPEYVIATGGSHWYPIYDPDGEPSAYLMATKVKFLYEWD
jgi:TolA-binding protein